jgi:C1A family cysteine protease
MIVAGRHLGGWRRDLAGDKRDWLMHAPAPGAAIPNVAYLDMRLVPVYDQLAIGSCGAQAGRTIVSYLDGLDDGVARDYSALYLYARSRQVAGGELADDSGVYIRDVFKALRGDGVCLEEEWAYGDGSNFSVEPNDRAAAAALLHQAKFYYRCPSLRTIRASIAHGFPVEIGFDCPTSLFSDVTSATGEVFYPERDTDFEGGHAIVLTGYDDAKSVGGDQGCFRFRNSWGAGWGAGGDGFIPYRFFEEGHAHDAWSLRSVEL